MIRILLLSVALTTSGCLFGSSGSTPEPRENNTQDAGADTPSGDVARDANSDGGFIGPDLNIPDLPIIEGCDDSEDELVVVVDRETDFAECDDFGCSLRGALEFAADYPETRVCITFDTPGPIFVDEPLLVPETTTILGADGGTEIVSTFGEDAPCEDTDPCFPALFRVVGPNVQLLGLFLEGPEGPQINPNAEESRGIEITNSGAGTIIAGVSLNGFNFGMFVRAPDVQVLSSYFGFLGLYGLTVPLNEPGDRLVIRDTTFVDPSQSVRIRSGVNMTVEDNVFGPRLERQHRTGVAMILERFDGAVIRGNVIEDMNVGIRINPPSDLATVPENPTVIENNLIGASGNACDSESGLGKYGLQFIENNGELRVLNNTFGCTFDETSPDEDQSVVWVSLEDTKFEFRGNQVGVSRDRLDPLPLAFGGVFVRGGVPSSEGALLTIAENAIDYAGTTELILGQPSVEHELKGTRVSLNEIGASKAGTDQVSVFASSAWNTEIFENMIGGTTVLRGSTANHVFVSQNDHNSRTPIILEVNGSGNGPNANPPAPSMSNGAIGQVVVVSQVPGALRLYQDNGGVWADAGVCNPLVLPGQATTCNVTANVGIAGVIEGKIVRLIFNNQVPFSLNLDAVPFEGDSFQELLEDLRGENAWVNVVTEGSVVDLFVAPNSNVTSPAILLQRGRVISRVGTPNQVQN